jgi:hypothetical protein
VRNVVGIGEKIIEHKVLWENMKKRPRRGREDNIKMNLEETDTSGLL